MGLTCDLITRISNGRGRPYGHPSNSERVARTMGRRSFTAEKELSEVATPSSTNEGLGKRVHVCSIRALLPQLPSSTRGSNRRIGHPRSSSSPASLIFCAGAASDWLRFEKVCARKLGCRLNSPKMVLRFETAGTGPRGGKRVGGLW